MEYTIKEQKKIIDGLRSNTEDSAKNQNEELLDMKRKVEQSIDRETVLRKEIANLRGKYAEFQGKYLIKSTAPKDPFRPIASRNDFGAAWPG